MRVGAALLARRRERPPAAEAARSEATPAARVLGLVLVALVRAGVDDARAHLLEALLRGDREEMHVPVRHAEAAGSKKLRQPRASRRELTVCFYVLMGRVDGASRCPRL